MPDIYGKQTPLVNAPEILSTTNIGRNNINVDRSSLGADNPFVKDTRNDLQRLMDSTDSNLANQAWTKAELYTEPVIKTPFKFTARYLDPTLGFDATDEDLEIKYGEQQGTWQRIGNRLAKTGATAAIAFAETINSTINLLTGTENVDNEGNTWGNEWLERLDSEVLPNYQTAYQRDNPLLSFLNPLEFKSWLDNAGKVTQNLGYTIGAIAAAAVIDIPVAALTEGLGTIPLLARQSGKIFSSIGKLSRIVAGSAEEYAVYRQALQSGDDIVKALAKASDLRKGLNTTRFLNGVALSAYGESVMEGNNLMREVEKDLQSRYVDEFGNFNGDEALRERIHETAKEAGKAGIKGNMAFLTISNMVGLGSILRPGAAAIRATESALSREMSVKLVGNNINRFELIANKSTGLKGLVKAFANPRNLVTQNAKEAVEEGYQYGVEQGARRFYEREFDLGANKDVNNLSDSINHAFSEVFTTTAGQESMLMGLLGGMVQAGIQGRVQRAQGIKRGAALGESMVKELNSVGVTSMFDVARNEAVTATSILNEMQEAAKTGDMFKYKNLQHQQLFNFVHSGVRAHKFDARIEQLEALKKLSKEDFQTLFNLELNEQNSQTVSQYVDGVIAKAKEIKGEIDKVNTVFGTNPYSRSKEKTNHEIFERYKGELALTLSEQKDHLRRVRILRDQLSESLPGAEYQPVINLASELGIEETLTGFNTRIEDLRKTEELAKDNPTLTRGMKEEREYLEEKVSQIQDAVKNQRTYEKDFLGIVNSLHNYYANGNSLYGDNRVSRVDSIAIFERSRDINQLAENTKRIEDYYRKLTGNTGFGDFYADFQRRISNFEARVRIDENGRMKIMTDAELDQAAGVASTTAEPVSKEAEEYVKNTLGVDSLDDAERRINEGDKEFIAKILDPNEEVDEEDEKSLAQKIRDGEVEITEEMKETARNRVREEFTEPEEAEEDVEEEDGKSKTKAEKRAAKMERARKSKKIIDPDEEDASDINDTMEEDRKKKKSSTKKTAPATEPISTDEEVIETQEEVKNPFVRFWNKFKFNVLNELNRLYTFNKETPTENVEYKTNLESIVYRSMTPQSLTKNVVSKMRLVVQTATKGKTPDQHTEFFSFDKNGKRVYFDNLHRSGFGVDAMVYVDDKPIGILHPPTSLKFKRGDEYLTLDQFRDAAEYSSATGNDASSFEQFKKDFEAYKKAYDKVIEGFTPGTTLEVSNERLMSLFKPIISYGSVAYTNDPKEATKIGKLRYRGVGDAVLSFPIEIDPKTGLGERVSTPTILNKEELTDEQIAETLEYVSNNLEKIKNFDTRYIYIMRMPNGSLDNKSIIAARPVDEAATNLDDFIVSLQEALSNEDKDALGEINQRLGNSTYVAFSRGRKNTDVRRKTKSNARFYVSRDKMGAKRIKMSVFNRYYNSYTTDKDGKAVSIPYRSIITFSQREINELKNFDEFLALVNRKVAERKETDRILTNIGFELTKDNFKVHLPNDDTVTLGEVKNNLTIAVTSKIFKDANVTFLPVGSEHLTAPVSSATRRAPKPAATTTAPTTAAPVVTAPTAATASVEMIDDREYNDFVDKNIVTEARLDEIAFKVKENRALSPREFAIFTGRTADVNTRIAAMSKPTAAVDVVNKNLNTIINQLKTQGIVQTTC